MGKALTFLGARAPRSLSQAWTGLEFPEPTFSLSSAEVGRSTLAHTRPQGWVWWVPAGNTVPRAHRLMQWRPGCHPLPTQYSAPGLLPCPGHQCLDGTLPSWELSLSPLQGQALRAAGSFWQLGRSHEGW